MNPNLLLQAKMWPLSSYFFRGAVGETTFHVCFLMGTPTHMYCKNDCLNDITSVAKSLSQNVAMFINALLLRCSDKASVQPNMDDSVEIDLDERML